MTKIEIDTTEEDVSELSAVLSVVVGNCIQDLMENLNSEIFKEREE